MARRNRDGKIILAAGEIGAYTVCPESWRLRSLEKVQGPKLESVHEGQVQHHAWADQFDESAYLFARIRFVISLLIAATLMFIYTHL
jgi:hypothetical protein